MVSVWEVADDIHISAYARLKSVAFLDDHLASTERGCLENLCIWYDSVIVVDTVTVVLFCVVVESGIWEKIIDLCLFMLCLYFIQIEYWERK